MPEDNEVREYVEFIPTAGVCLTTKNVMERRGMVRWMKRDPSSRPADNGWRIFSHIDTAEYLEDPTNWQIEDYNNVCLVEPALIGIYDFPVGSDLQIVRDERGISIYDTPTGRRIPEETFYVPPQFRE
ncbi:Protein of uncharacterised function (DUF2185) [Mycobacteroides abscessus subsp. abscessus]|uniref:immunity protein Imm33 domain-containing protein n=1 Tax=Mycobacteroides abscessus TaxID=36809 RepID=UPI00092A1C81|nr:DUF2185 domain-containing protein [Mycobacteroides abscessus]SHV14651.1 Protein of uncharacterised function (DUF2185) [Mycobacteroides abscessus subsp. abscessus]SKD11162.1 Protein of uncharacterised function (DUF2185) [Mycobacteroides abscessus subsp. abscessus]SKL37568.1 Protein of uncharacterised function (DUF2185) [Mycobacteroides abscessus subsp. abscessus]SKM28084.1 Protein of uncharacterised function (DUF2185) [Mycobacteroides abscessus subsp. abscessus]